MRIFFIIMFLCALFTVNFAQNINFEEHFLADDYIQACGVCIIDLNEDGYKDIVGCAMGGGGKVSWWENDGTQNFIRHDLTTSFALARSVIVEDIDNDGLLDVLAAGTSCHTVAWWKNLGSGNFEYNAIDTAFIGAHTVDAKDVNADGFMDVLCSGFDSSANNSEIAWWENDGNSPIFWTKHVISTRFQQSPFIQGAHINSDNFLDVVACGEINDEVYWWENDGTGSWIEHEIDSNFNGVHTVIARDVDQDNDMDIIGSACLGSLFNWYENTGNENFVRHNIQAVGGAIWLDVVDIDNNGILDLAGGGQGMASIAWWENDGMQNFSMNNIPGSCAGPFCVVPEDIDNDGDADLAAAGWTSGQMRWWENMLYSVNFSAVHTSGHAPSQIDFIDESNLAATIESWAWDFQNDGIIDSNEQNPSFIYTEPGIYSVSLQVNYGINSASITKENYITIFNGHSALEFDGEASNVNVPAATVPEINGAFTIEAWIYPYSYGPEANFGLGRIFDKSSISLFLSNSFPLFMDQSLVVQMMHADGTISTSTTPATSVALNEWQHVAVSYDGIDEVNMFVNGFQMMFYQPTAPTGALEDNNEADILIGNISNLSKGFDGLIDEVRVWDVFKNQNEILAEMNHYLNGYETNLVLYWRFNEGWGEYVFDETDNTMGIIQDAIWQQGIELEPAGTSDYQLPTTNIQLSNYPNPFNPSTTISFNLTAGDANNAKVEIYNLKGQKVKTLRNFLIAAGENNCIWNGRNDAGKRVASGEYLAILKLNDEIVTERKLMLVK